MGSLATRGQCRGDVGRAGADAVARALVACLIAFSSLSATAAPGLASEPEPARIKGVVTSSDGVPLTDVTITVYHERGPDDYWYKGMFFTGSDGSYECTIDPGAHYPPFVLKLEDRTRRHASQMVGSPSIFTPEEATHFSPSPGETLDGVDIVLQEGGVIEGHVRSRDDGRPLFGRTVVAAQAWVETLDGGEWREPSNIGWRLWSGTDDDGAYAITGLESREYRLQFRDNWGTILPEDMKDAHQWIYFGNEADPARATPVSVDGTQTTSGVDIDPVQARARIFGTDRYQTARAASRHAFGAGEAKSVVVASG
ncbi:MAG: hypothetical protein Q8M66_02990, partial [Actinomycetota bacterium]|nr:hypothetical protein [Actinomycetota bacterium]